MDPRKEAAEILHTTPPPKRKRAPHGQWVAPARTVLGLVGAGWNISDAIREVIARHGFVTAKEGTDERKRQFRQAFDGIRASYYIASGRRGSRKSRKPDDFQL